MEDSRNVAQQVIARQREVVIKNIKNDATVVVLSLSATITAASVLTIFADKGLATGIVLTVSILASTTVVLVSSTRDLFGSLTDLMVNISYNPS